MLRPGGREGYTITELVAVVAIVGVLSVALLAGLKAGYAACKRGIVKIDRAFSAARSVSDQAGKDAGIP